MLSLDRVVVVDGAVGAVGDLGGSADVSAYTNAQWVDVCDVSHRSSLPLINRELLPSYEGSGESGCAWGWGVGLGVRGYYFFPVSQLNTGRQLHRCCVFDVPVKLFKW